MEKLGKRLTKGQTQAVKMSSCDLFESASRGDTWEPMINHLIASVESQGTSPVIGVGHSLGGGVLAGAASKRPDLFSHLIFVDPSLFNVYNRIIWSIAFRLPASLIHELHPLYKAALKKDDRWRSKEEAEEYLRSKRLYSSFHPDVFKIYMDECIVPPSSEKHRNCTDRDQPNVQMLFSKQTESEIYLKVPTDIPFLSKHNMKLYEFTTPSTLLYTRDRSTILGDRDIRWMRNKYKDTMQFEEFAGTHFWPLDQPDDFANHISGVVQRITSEEESISDDVEFGGTIPDFA